MNLHEYQAKKLLSAFGVTVPVGRLAKTPEEAIAAANTISEETGSKRFAVKAQIHAGGRGKGGGVKIAGSPEEAGALAGKILGMMLVTPQTLSTGKLVRKVYLEQDIFYPGAEEPQEFYLSFLLDRKKGRLVCMYSPRGGMDIEQVAEETPEQIFTEEIHPVTGMIPFQARRIAFNLGLSGISHQNMVRMVMALYEACQGLDASLLEINPLFRAADGRVFAADAKLAVDNSALFRHPDILAMRDLMEEDPTEVEAASHHLNYVKLDGNVGCMVNGAGLAMATMDIVKQSGAAPANFLDVGGSADAGRVESAFRIILKDPNIKAILVNIFGGIVRCDRVANGIVEAYRSIGNISVPVIVRLQGTNALEAKEIIDHSGMEVWSAISLEEAANLVAKAVK
ncbi:MAG TPA: ADP-forming succinate--CoA ligase subunit beta [Bacteroidales bacterium]|nr:ADP-forming succinate--CoA ligase subunit beta [Bacteroidales bacterium]HRZ49044.1 ADP-forming succinate--CoA ligase subunit beta [Bacteroidales bacterium]